MYCDARKAALLRCESDSELHGLLCSDPLRAGVHVVPLGQVASDRIQGYLARWTGRWRGAVAFRPTGWTYQAPKGADPAPSVRDVIARVQSARAFTYADLKPARNSAAMTPTSRFIGSSNGLIPVVTYGVPYSEHSSFGELACFAVSLDWGRMIATVGVGSAKGRERVKMWVGRWEKERRRRREEGEDAAGVVGYRSLEYW